MAWSRVIELSVGSDGSGLDMSGLHVDFRIERSISVAQQRAEFTVYNAKEETRKEVLRSGNNVVFRAGYEDEGLGTLFIGSIIDAQSQKRDRDWRTTINAAALRGQSTALARTNVALSYAPGTELAAVIGDIGTALGLVVFGQAQARIALPNGLVFAGNARRALAYAEEILVNNGAGLYVDNGEIVIYRDGEQQSGEFGSTLLDYDTGLLSVEDITEAGDQRRRVRFRTLLIPKLQPNGLITVRTERVSGTFIIERVAFSGSNYGESFIAEGEAVA